MGRKLTDISPKKTYIWLINTWKDAQYHSLLDKWKSNLQWDITLYRSEWPSSKCLVGFTSEAINWTQKFFCREFCDSITLFLCDSVLGGFVVLGICPLYLVIPFVGEQVFTVLYNDFFRTNTPKRCSFHHRELECKSRKSRDPWSNRQVWPWSIKWSRAKSNRVLP